MREARRIVQSDQLVTATGLATWLKPDAYFDMAWRRHKGGGPILINLIHDIDLLRFLMGEIDSVQAASAPWNWYLAAGESAHYARQDVNSHFISDTHGSLTLPRLELWDYKNERGWHQPITQTRSAVHDAKLYAEQLCHFHAAIDRSETPVCNGRDAMRSLQAVLAVQQAAESGQLIKLDDVTA